MTTDSIGMVGELKVRIYRDSDNNWTEKLIPEVLPTNKYDYVKFALLSAEIAGHLHEQVLVVNVDEDDRIKQMTDKFVTCLETDKPKQTEFNFKFREKGKADGG